MPSYTRLQKEEEATNALGINNDRRASIADTAASQAVDREKLDNAIAKEREVRRLEAAGAVDAPLLKERDTAAQMKKWGTIGAASIAVLAIAIAAMTGVGFVGILAAGAIGGLVGGVVGGAGGAVVAHQNRNQLTNVGRKVGRHETMAREIHAEELRENGINPLDAQKAILANVGTRAAEFAKTASDPMNVAGVRADLSAGTKDFARVQAAKAGASLG